MSSGLAESKVQIYTYNHIIEGNIEYLANLRLLDYLNYTQRNYVKINRVTIYNCDKTTSSFKQVHVNRDNIFFIKEIESTRQSIQSGEIKEDIYPYVKKIKVDIQFIVPMYRLCGKMHLGRGQSPNDLINSEQLFFPLTELEIISNAGNVEKDIDFVAVNSRQVLLLAELLA